MIVSTKRRATKERKREEREGEEGERERDADSEEKRRHTPHTPHTSEFHDFIKLSLPLVHTFVKYVSVLVVSEMKLLPELRLFFFTPPPSTIQ